MLVLTYIYIACVLIAALSSLISFRLDFPFHLKLFSGLLVLTALVEMFAYILVYVLHIKNHWLYNTFVLVEFCVYGYFYYRVSRIPVLRKIILFLLAFFPVFWIITVLFVFGLNTWNSYIIIVLSFFSVLFAIAYYCELITSRDIQSLRNLPEFWIATGMLIFYLGALPYFGTLNFLLKYHLEVAKSLSKVFKILDAVMYALFSYGFLCRILNTRKS